MEGQESPPQVSDINDPNIPQNPSLIALEVPSDSDVPTQVSAPATEVPRRSTIVISQPDAYAPSMTVKSYKYAMT